MNQSEASLENYSGTVEERHVSHDGTVRMDVDQESIPSSGLEVLILHCVSIMSCISYNYTDVAVVINHELRKPCLYDYGRSQ